MKYSVEEANYILQLKITKTIKENKDKLENLRQKIEVLEKEKELLYKGDNDVLEKIYNVYLKEVK